jgi:vitamin B12 transporter
MTCLRMSVLVLAIPFSSAYSQNTDLQEIFVTANRIGQPIESVLMDVDVLKKTDIDVMGVTNLTQALNHLPGFQGISYGQNSVFLRGTESRMTALYLEGIRIETHDGLHLGGGAPWEMMPLEMVERLEVIKGPASAIYGSDAMGGVVQMFGKKATSEDRPTLTQSFGSHGLKQSTGQISGKNQHIDFSLVLSTSYSDGYDTRPDLLHTPSTEASSKNVGLLKMGYDFSSSSRLELVSFKSRQAYLSATCILDSTTWECLSDPSTDIKNQNQISAEGLKWLIGIDDQQVITAKLNTSSVAAESDAPNASDLPWKYETTARSFGIDHEYLSPFGQFRTLIEKKQDQFFADANENPTFFLSNAAVHANRSQYALGFGYHLHHSSHLLNLSIRSDAYTYFPRHKTYAMSYGYEFSDGWTVSAHQSSGFKAPSLEQMHGQFGSVSLLPEVNTSKEFALQYANESAKVRITTFENKISNLISSKQTLTTCDAGWFCYYNVGQVRIQGLSLSGNLKVDNLNLQSSLDLLNPVDASTGKQLTLRSKQNVRIAADKPLGDSRVGLEYQHVGKRFDDANNLVSFPAYNLVHVWTKTRLSSDWSWLNRIDNLFNEKYQQLGCTIAGVNSCHYAMPGVTLFTSMQWSPR